MKCPSCGLTCSNLRDLCPGCYKDLREHKKQSGIPVTNPRATYDELLRKVKKNFPDANVEVAAASTSLPTAESSNGSSYAEAAPVESPRETTSHRDPSIYEEMIENVVAVSAVEISSRSEVLKIDEVKKPPIIISDIDPEEVSSLFDFAFLTLSQHSLPREVEFSLHELQDAKSSEDIVLYFEMARDEIENPDSVRKFTSDIAFSEKAHVEAKSLEKELSNVTKQLDRVVISLKGDSAEKESVFKKPKKEVVEEFTEAPMSLRVLGVSIDLALSLALGIGLGLSLETLYSTSHEGSLMLLRSGDSVATVSILGSIISSSVLSVLFYQWICLFTMGRTIGAEIFSMRLVTETGAPVHASNQFVRGATFPLSVFAFGFIPLFFGSRAIHDLASRTTVRKRTVREV